MYIKIIKGGEKYIMKKCLLLASLVTFVAGILTNNVASFLSFNQPKSPSMLVK